MFFRDIWENVNHCLGTWRNKEMHDEDFVCLENLVQHVHKLKIDYDYAAKVNKLVTDREFVMTLI